MIVLDANILIRAVLGERDGQLLYQYSQLGIRFYAPETAYGEAEEYLPALLRKKGKPDTDLASALYLKSKVGPVEGNPTEYLHSTGCPHGGSSSKEILIFGPDRTR